MPIKSNLEKHTINWLKRQDSDGKLNKNISIQRKEIWDDEKKSNLILSLLLDIPVESLLFEEAENGSYNVLDGKQRTLTICSFIDGGFALSKKVRVQGMDGIAVAYQTFQSMPATWKEKILEYELSISILRPLDEDERATVFFMRNQAVALSKMDLSLVILGQKAMDEFSKLCEHNFMLNKIKLTKPAIRKREDLGVLLQYLILEKRPEFGFSGKEIMKFCDDIKNEKAEVPFEAVAGLLDYLDSAFPSKMAYLKKVHLPIIMFMGQKFKDNGTFPEEFGLSVHSFFEHLDPTGEYMAACMAGSAKRSNVQVRIRSMEESILTAATSQKH